MIELKLTFKGQSSNIQFDLDDILIGKSSDAQIQIKGWLVTQKHAVIKRLPAGYVIEDLDRGANGTVVNEKRIDIYGPLEVGDLITIQKYQFEILKIWLENEPKPNPQTQVDKEDFSRDIHEQKLQNTSNITEQPQKHNIIDTMTSAMTIYQDRSIDREKDIKLMKELHAKLIAFMDLRRKDVSKMSDEELTQETLDCLDQIIENDFTIDKNKIDRIKKLVLNEAVGLGPLEELLADKDVSEIMVNSSQEIYVERNGRIALSPAIFSSDQAVMDIIERIVSPIGRRIDESSPMVDARLKDGSRVNAIIPPLAIKGPTITIRKFPEKRLAAKDLVLFESLSEDMADFLEICVKYKKNVIISGGTGSGKTTLLNVLSIFIPPFNSNIDLFFILSDVNYF